MSDSANLKRRNFLLGVGMGGAGAAAGVLGVKAVLDARGQGESDKKETASRGGYRMTEHVANYYRTTRI
jgi:hypothetical protein